MAKTTSSINLDRTLRDASLPDDEKVKRYVDELYKYLHLRDARQFADQPPVKRRKKLIVVTSKRPPSKPTVAPPALTPQASLRKLRYATDIDKGGDEDDEGKEEVFILPPLRDKKKRKVDDADWSVTRKRENRNNLLHVNYTTRSFPGSFGAAQSLKRHTKGATLDDAKRYLVARDAYTLHRQRRVSFPRRKTYSKGIAYLYQADLADLKNISRYNDKYRFLLPVIDVFSKKSLSRAAALEIRRPRDRRLRKNAVVSEMCHATDRSRYGVHER